jgi:hypothetical protein
MKNLFLCFLVIIILFSCAKTPKNNKEKIIADLELNDFQSLIYELVSDVHDFVGLPFITYIIIGTDDDEFYERTYLLAMIDDIDKNLNNHYSLLCPFAFIFDVETDELVRYYFPDIKNHNLNYEEMVDNFGLQVLEEIFSLSQDKHIETTDKMSSTNMWRANSFFEHEQKN